MGALHGTGVGGPVSETIRGPSSAETVLVVAGAALGGTVVGADVEVATEVVEVATDVVVDARAGRFEWPLLLHAVSTTTAAIIVTEPSRGRRTPRS
ncbi:MAG: hypothetical protein QOG50_1644 [Actinomycetota bacterium]|nr:hypothetical protein [Actinomycetota bacterium]